MTRVEGQVPPEESQDPSNTQDPDKNLTADESPEEAEESRRRLGLLGGQE